MWHILKNHPVIAAGGLMVGAGVKHHLQWRKGTAYVRYLESTPDGHVKVEMDEDYTFIAVPEHLQSLHAAKQTRTPVRYWINNFKTVYGLPRGGIGGRG
jgi:hypothetical protein